MKIKIISAIALISIVTVGLIIYFVNSDEDPSPTIVSVTTTPTSKDEPTLTAEVLIDDLSNVWDIAFLPDNTLLFTERNGDLSRVVDGKKSLIAKIPNVYVQGEGGLMGLAVDSDFENNNYIYVCQNYNSGKTLDVRVARFELSGTNLSEPTYIVTGMPSKESGRHSGCRVKSAGNGHLWITTGDAAQASNPQSPSSLGGKVLRVNRDGKGIEGNLEDPFDNRIFSYGHRNVQGIVLFDSSEDGVFGYTSEHGPDIDDEINELKTGNFGWNPGSGYNEGVPMTDLNRFPDAHSALWSSGDPTMAVSGISLLTGKEWGSFEGHLAVASLKAQHLRIIGIEEGKIIYEREFFSEFGRLRSAVLDRQGNLYLSTDNSRDDKIIKVAPSS